MTSEQQPESQGDPYGGGLATRGACVGPTDSSGQTLIRKVGGSALNLAARFGLITLISAITTIAITRLLLPTGYGIYGSAVATSAVLGAVSDFGFSTMLSRDMADQPVQHRSLLRAAYEVALSWSALLGLIMVGLAFAAGITSSRGEALLVLAPSMVFNGLNPARILFVVRYQTRRLVTVDVIFGVVQMLVSIAMAAAGLGPVAVAASASAASILDNIAIAVMAERMLPRGGIPFSRLELVRRSAPLGVMSIMTKVYLTIDLVLLGWYLAGTRLGDYAAASKLLTVLAGLAGVVMGGALPGLASTARDTDQLNKLVERVWHWLIVVALPLFVGLALFAPLAIRVSIGGRYQGAIALIRILSIAGAVTVLSNLVGNVMVALRRVRQLFIQNSVAVIVNIVGNLVLIPHYGAYAAAWMTVVTEVVVCSCALFSLRRDLKWSRLLRVSWRPTLGILLASSAALPLLRSQCLALGAGVAVFVLSLAVLAAWPSEFNAVRLGLPRARSGSRPG